MGEEKSLFVWRGTLDLDDEFPVHGYSCEWYWRDIEGLPEVYTGFRKHCPFCGGEYHRESNTILVTYYFKNSCPVCGFTADIERWDLITKEKDGKPGGSVSEYVKFATLRNLTLNNSELSFAELGSHLKRRHDDVHSLSARRWEELVADVYRQQGYSVRLTQTTRDGGYDIVLLEGSSGIQTIVEVKRYAKERKVGVGTVRQLLGVQLRTGHKHAVVVTSSSFSPDAMAEASAGSHRALGYDLTLQDIEWFLRQIEAYNEPLPPLHLDERFLAHDE